MGISGNSDIWMRTRMFGSLKILIYLIDDRYLQTRNLACCLLLAKLEQNHLHKIFFLMNKSLFELVILSLIWTMFISLKRRHWCALFTSIALALSTTNCYSQLSPFPSSSLKNYVQGGGDNFPILLYLLNEKPKVLPSYPPQGRGGTYKVLKWGTRNSREGDRQQSSLL